MATEVNPLVCDECGHESGIPFTARSHAKTHNVEPTISDGDVIETEVVEKPKKARKKAEK